MQFVCIAEKIYKKRVDFYNFWLIIGGCMIKYMFVSSHELSSYFYDKILFSYPFRGLYQKHNVIG